MPQVNPPVVNVSGSVSLQSTKWVQGSALPFTVSDPDGHAIQTYRFIDVGGGSTSARSGERGVGAAWSSRCAPVRYTKTSFM